MQATFCTAKVIYITKTLGKPQDKHGSYEHYKISHGTSVYTVTISNNKNVNGYTNRQYITINIIKGLKWTSSQCICISSAYHLFFKTA